MATYEYRCPTCEYDFEVTVPMSKHVDPDECPECHSDAVHRIYRSFGVQYRCMGFHTTDTGRD